MFCRSIVYASTVSLWCSLAGPVGPSSRHWIPGSWLTQGQTLGWAIFANLIIRVVMWHKLVLIGLKSPEDFNAGKWWKELTWVIQSCIECYLWGVVSHMMLTATLSFQNQTKAVDLLFDTHFPWHTDSTSWHPKFNIPISLPGHVNNLPQHRDFISSTYIHAFIIAFFICDQGFCKLSNEQAILFLFPVFIKVTRPKWSEEL